MDLLHESGGVAPQRFGNPGDLVGEVSSDFETGDFATQEMVSGGDERGAGVREFGDALPQVAFEVGECLVHDPTRASMAARVNATTSSWWA